MITFLVRCRMQGDAAKRAEVERLVKELSAAVEVQETDAVSYAFFGNSHDTGELTLVESYADNETFLAHNTSPHMLRFRERFTELFDPAGTEVTFLECIAGFGRAWSATPVEAASN